jgi:crossover junction endodeoxyribonuclease RuvC
MILGLDLSSADTGYAIIDKGELVDFGSIQPPKKLDQAQKIEYIYSNVLLLLDKFPIKKIIIEDQFIGAGRQTAIFLVRISGAIFLIAAQHDIPLKVVAPTHVKSVFTGTGKADKAMMLYKANTIYNLNITNENIADAIGVATTGWREDNV